MHHLLRAIIAQEFIARVGKFQRDKEHPQAMLISFAVPCHDDEEGYRTLDMLIYAPLNYVQVWTRERWDVIPLFDLDYDEQGEAKIKRGKKYTAGHDPWTKVADHDSCWPEGIENTLKKNTARLLTFVGHDTWYQTVDPRDFTLLVSP